MKKIVWVMAASMVLMMAAGCSKSHQCKCVTTDIEDDGTLKIFEVEGSISCDNITEMAFEEHVAAEGGGTLQRVEVHQVKCRDYGS
ncbi:MAG: hypothetical protein J5677_03115 [Bacteroidales bacterium]|nr:hypothetical protein [Bacteroidales bacterium]